MLGKQKGTEMVLDWNSKLIENKKRKMQWEYNETWFILEYV